MDSVLYPSITVCAKYALGPGLFHDVIDSEEENEIDVSNNVSKIIKNQLWTLEDEMYFFTQPGVMNLTFPCMTTLGGVTPGRPCIFPVTWTWGVGSWWGTDTFSGCISPSDFMTSKSGCFTTVYENNTVDSFKGTDILWGYCPDTCNGESPTPTSPYNLARSEYTNLWKSDLYDLDAWSNSYCQTYDPPFKTKPDLQNRIYFVLQALQANWTDYPLPQLYDIFIHQKGQFWPRSDMGLYGQPDPITVSLIRSSGRLDDLELSFSVKEISHFNTKENPCDEDKQFSLTACLHEYAIKRSKCKLNIFGKPKEQKELCTKEGFKLYVETLQFLKQADIHVIEKASGCQRKCMTIEYSYEKNLQKSQGENNNRSEVFIQAKTAVVTYLTEYYTFDGNDFISSLGGNLGLFLGWSFLTLFEVLGLIFLAMKMQLYKL